MRTTVTKQVMTALVGLAVISGGLAIHAGDLEPPGPPAPTMRIPIRSADLPLTITSAGTYYLAEDITASGGITITADDVTIDLMGHTFAGGAGTAISNQSTNDRAVVMNGTVRDWGGAGVYLLGPDSLVVNVRAENNGGTGGEGILVGAYGEVRDCQAIQNNFGGIKAGPYSRVSHCFAVLNDGEGISVGINSTVADSTATNHLALAGIYGDTGSRIERCSVSDCAWGIVVESSCVVVDSLVTLAEQSGILAQEHSQIRGCSVTQSSVGIQAWRSIIRDNNVHDSTIGIHATGSSRVEGNLLEGNEDGIVCIASDNVIVKNVSINNTSDDYACSLSEDVGPIGHAWSSTSGWANIDTYP